jgi:hypothetical protein
MMTIERRLASRFAAGLAIVLAASQQAPVDQSTGAVAAAGAADAAWEKTYEQTFTDPKGQPVTDRGKYVSIWRKQADGWWKVVQDIFNSDLPLPGS